MAEVPCRSVCNKGALDPEYSDPADPEQIHRLSIWLKLHL